MTRTTNNALLKTNRYALVLTSGRALALLALVLAGAMMLALPADALAQAASSEGPERVLPPRPQEPADPPVIRNFLVAGVVLISIIAATVIPAKRGHQD